MKMRFFKVKRIVLFFSFTLLSLQTQTAPEWSLWTAIRLPSERISNIDVLDYIETTRLDDQNRLAMFKEAKGDYSKYNTLKRQWSQKRFESGLRQLTYFKIIEKEATRGSPEQWKAFKVTESEYYRATKEIEDKALKELLKEGKGIRYAWEEFGKKLIERGWPYKKKRTPTEIYFTWFQLQKDRVKEQWRLREVQRFENYIVKKTHLPLISTTKISDFYQSTIQLVQEKLQGKSLKEEEVTQIFYQHLQMKIVIQYLQYISMGRTSLVKIAKQAPLIYEQSKRIVQQKVIPKLKEGKLERLLLYQETAFNLAGQHKSPEKLRQLAKESTQKFLAEKKTYSQLMLAKLYELAAYQLEYQPDITQARQQLTKIASVLITELIAHLQNENFLLAKENEHLRLEDAASKLMNKIVRERYPLANRPYQQKAVGMIIWALKFEIKRVALQQKPVLHVALFDPQSIEGQKRIRQYLRQNQYVERLNRYRQGELRSYWQGLLEVNLDGQTPLRGQVAYHFLLEN